MLINEAIEKYFLAEKAESWIYMAIGIAAMLVAFIAFFFLKTSFYKGAAIPLLLIGLLLGITGFTVNKRSDEDRIRNVYALSMNPGELKKIEMPRMKDVMQNLVIYRYVAIIFAFLGILMMLYCYNNPIYLFGKGFGMALAIMATFSFWLDYFAEKRGRIYLEQLNDFIQ